MSDLYRIVEIPDPTGEVADLIAELLDTALVPVDMNAAHQWIEDYLLDLEDAGRFDVGQAASEIMDALTEDLVAAAKAEDT